MSKLKDFQNRAIYKALNDTTTSLSKLRSLVKLLGLDLSISSLQVYASRSELLASAGHKEYGIYNTDSNGKKTLYTKETFGRLDFAKAALEKICLDKCKEYVAENHEKGNCFVVLCKESGALWGAGKTESAAWRNAKSWLKKADENAVLDESEFTVCHGYTKKKISELDAHSVAGNNPDVRIIRKV